MHLQELEIWLQQRPKWQQDALHRLVQNGSLTDKDFNDLLTICTAEATGQPVTFVSVPAGALNVQDTTKQLRLESIGDVQGINKLSPSKPLEFGKTPLCIVYGRNGAGKSGYVRLLKHACGARRPGDLLSNIFLKSAQPKAAKFTFTYDTQTKPAHWTGKPILELQGVEIYDTDCGLVYVDEEKEVAFEPWLLRLFTQLTNACTTLSQRIKEQIAKQVSNKPVLPAEYAPTLMATWYANITINTDAKKVDEKTAWTSGYEANLTAIQKRLAETNPTARAATLRRQKAIILDLMANLKTHFDSLTNEHCIVYLAAKAEAETKRKAADKDAKKVFEKAPLAGIGSESWRLLWEAARKYSEEYAYKIIAFPNLAEDARCILCQRELDQDSRDRFISFKKFVHGELQQLASEAEQNLQIVATSFSEIPAIDALSIKLEAAGITEDKLKEMVTEFALTLVKRKQTCLETEEFAHISSLPSCNVLLELETIAADFERQAIACDEDAKGQNSPELERAAKELSARKWLHQQRKAIDDEITRLRTINLFEEADRLTNTLALSKRKSVLAEELITDAYIKRFQDELIQLKASSIAVELKKTRAEVGRVYHKISLRNAVKNVKTSDILSEGEFRIVSIAAFLADTEGRGAKTPFIFDDPISSLDQVYEEATAQRLVELSKSRQVIVFTHRLSLVGLLEKYKDKAKVDTTIVCLSRTKTGDIADLPITLTKTKPTAKRLLNERINKATKVFQTDDAEYDKEAKALCRDIRILIEQIVETDLLSGVVRRYNPEVQTKGKIEQLAKITQEDCKFVDEMMTKYSRYEHSQPEEAPIESPNPDEMESDLKAICGFVEKIQQRNAA